MTRLPPNRIEIEQTNNKAKSSGSKSHDYWPTFGNSTPPISDVSSENPPPPPPALPYLQPAFADDCVYRITYQRFLLRANVSALLPLAQEARGYARRCSFGDCKMGALNFAIISQFDDGVEWIIKTPQEAKEASLERIGSKVVTLLYLEEL